MFSERLPDPEQGRRNTILGSPVSLYDIVADAESGFGPLRTLLGTISAAGADRQVAHNSLIGISTLH